MLTSVLYLVSKELETALFDLIGDYAGSLMCEDLVSLRFRTRQRHPRKMGCVMVQYMDWRHEEWAVKRLVVGHWRKAKRLNERETICRNRLRSLIMQFRLLEVDYTFLEKQMEAIMIRGNLNYTLQVS